MRIFPTAALLPILAIAFSFPTTAEERAATPAVIAAQTYAVGTAQVDITPSYPVRLSGFGFRRTESEGVTQRIWAKALAIDDGEPAVLITTDNLGVSAAIVKELAGRLERKAGLKPNRLAVTATHTHTAPMLHGVAPTLFGQPIPAEHQEHIDRYTAEFTENLEKAALAALAERQPAKLSWGIGQVGFAMNRRTKGGPVDHDLPVLVVRDLQGKVRAIYVSYACHCVTLSNNKIGGDWAGFAQQQIQDEFPGAVALLSVGCGADSNPNSGVTGDKVEVATRQGAEVAAAVKRLIGGYLAPVYGKLFAAARTIELPLDTLPTRAEWEEKAKRKDAIGYHAQVQLARLDRGEALQSKVAYPIQSWAFSDSLAMVFLPGEVVVDYSLRLKRELDRLRVWINAYANDDPCYIPSERVLREGGYEGGAAMVYYDLPTRLKPGLENNIVEVVREQLEKSFKCPFDAQRTPGSQPLSPQQSLAAIRTKKDLAVDLVVAEPMVIDPVAIDWGPDGRLWVAEMVDYPSGRKGDFQPGGRIRVLEDSTGSGQYDKATIFLDNIPFPTGIRVWRNGVLICAAPDILYAEDTKRDGKADVVKKLFSGFGTENYQARVNSLEYGLDGWVYGSCGLFGGAIQSFAGGKPVELGNRDFRIKPDEGILEPATGRTQQGRVRNDWGDWFGCDNSNFCWHYPLAEHYLRRNPHVAPPSSVVSVPGGPDPSRVFPAQDKLQLFKLSGPPGRATSACGLGIYRDELLGREYAGNAFICEPVNLLVHRLVLSPQGSTFTGRRADDERTSEFLASTDNWFRPVQVRTGPDGALWIVDMYRYVIEHPRWIPPEERAKVDVRAGDTMGRIYRIRSANSQLQAAPRLDKLDIAGLVAALDSPNGWQRDLAGQMLLWRADKTAIRPLVQMARASQRPEARLHAMCVLDGLGAVIDQVVLQNLNDRDPGVRRHAVRLSEQFLPKSRAMNEALFKLVNDPDAEVRLQLAFSLGASRDPRAGRALAELAVHHGDDRFLGAAVLSSVNSDNLAHVLQSLEPLFPASGRNDKAHTTQFIQSLLGVAIALDDRKALPDILTQIANQEGSGFRQWQVAALGTILDTAQRHGRTLDQIADKELADRLRGMLAQLRSVAADEKAAEPLRLAAMSALAREPGQREADREILSQLLVPQNTAELQSAAMTALGRIADDGIAQILAAGWKGYTPALKDQALDLLLSRAAWQQELLTAIEVKQIPAGHFDAKRRQRLMENKDAAIRARAARLFDAVSTPDRQKVLLAFQDVPSLAGDRTRGKAVFAKTCANCHRLENVGHVVGPDLAALNNKSPQYLLTEILDPNRNVDTRFIEYAALTKAGRTFTGILATETAASITLRGPEGKEQVLLRSELDELKSTGKSLMPEGLEKDLSKQDLADVIAYLSGGAGSPR